MFTRVCYKSIFHCCPILAMCTLLLSPMWVSACFCSSKSCPQSQISAKNCCSGKHTACTDNTIAAKLVGSQSCTHCQCFHSKPSPVAIALVSSVEQLQLSFDLLAFPLHSWQAIPQCVACESINLSLRNAVSAPLQAKLCVWRK
jgi:hypothetical protein